MLKHTWDRAFNPPPGAEPQWPLPQDVEGYDAAAVSGAIPASISSPPEQLLAPTAAHYLGVMSVFIGVYMILFVFVLFVGETLKEIHGILPVVGIFAYPIVMWRPFMSVHRKFQNAFLREVHAGYTTFRLTKGNFWKKSESPRSERVPRDLVRLRSSDVFWDWSQLWVLNSKGQVILAPVHDPNKRPPGLYPSPHIAGERELWTGDQWTLVFPDRTNDWE